MFYFNHDPQVSSSQTEFTVEIVAQQGPIRLSSDPFYTATCTYEDALVGEPGVEGEVSEG